MVNVECKCSLLFEKTLNLQTAPQILKDHDQRAVI